MVEAEDLTKAQAALELARRFSAQHHTAVAQVTSRSQVKVKARTPKKQKRSRR